MGMLELHAKIHGKVHGVGFRATTFRIAQDLGLKGSVRNTPDGAVEIIAQGEKEQLEQLLSKLKEIFSKGHIEEIKAQFVNPLQVLSSFSIIS